MVVHWTRGECEKREEREDGEEHSEGAHVVALVRRAVGLMVNVSYTPY